MCMTSNGCMHDGISPCSHCILRGGWLDFFFFLFSLALIAPLYVGVAGNYWITVTVAVYTRDNNIKNQALLYRKYSIHTAIMYKQIVVFIFCRDWLELYCSCFFLCTGFPPGDLFLSASTRHITVQAMYLLLHLFLLDAAPYLGEKYGGILPLSLWIAFSRLHA